MKEQIPPTLPMTIKHYTAITFFNINSIILIGSVALRIFIGFTPMSIIVMSTTLILNRVLGKIVNDRSGAELTEKDLQPKADAKSAFDRGLEFLGEKMDEAKDTLTKLILQPYMVGGERVLGVFRSYPLNDIHELVKPR